MDKTGKHAVSSPPDKKAVSERMVTELPDKPWADIEILDWLPGDETLPVEFSTYESRFGKVLIANTPMGICYLGVTNGKGSDLLSDFLNRFRYTDPGESMNGMQEQALGFLDGKPDGQLVLHLKGTNYQTCIWSRLLRIPSGKVISYAALGGDKTTARAAGTANGRNPVFYLIPCHRAVRSDGSYDSYYWGKEIKERLLTWEFENS